MFSKKGLIISGIFIAPMNKLITMISKVQSTKKLDFGKAIEQSKRC